MEETQLEKLNDIKKQLVDVAWIHVIVQIYEGILFTQLVQLSPESEGESIILTGVWVKAIGYIVEAIAVSNQINDTPDRLYWLNLAVTGDSIQTIGASLETAGGLQVISEEVNSPTTPSEFVI